MKLTTQKLHSIIRNAIGVKSSFYSPSQKIDRVTYDIHTTKLFYGVISGTQEYIETIRDAVKDAGLIFDDSEIDRGIIKVKKFQ